MLELLMQLKAQHAPDAAETTLEEIQGWFGGAGRELTRQDMIRLLKDSAVDAGLGEYISGRHGRQSRIRWSGLGTVQVAPKVADREAVVSAMPTKAQLQSAAVLEVPTSQGRVVLVVQGGLDSRDVSLVMDAVQSFVVSANPSKAESPSGTEHEDAEAWDALAEDDGAESEDEQSPDGSEESIEVPSLRPDLREHRHPDLEAFVQDALKLLPRKKWKHVLALTIRFGLDGSGFKTFDEVGAQLGVKRQRVQQIEAAFVKVARGALRSRARHAAAAWLRDVVGGPHRGTGFITTSELGALRLNRDITDGWVQLVLSISFGDVARGGDEPVMSALADSCLSRFSRFGAAGWLANPEWPEEDLEDIADWLSDFAKRPVRLPIALEPLAEQLGKPLEMLEAVLGAHPVLTPYAGYVLREGGDAGQRRAVRAHVLASHLSPEGRGIPFHALWVSYRERFSDIDPCSSNDLRVALTADKAGAHLFVVDTNRSVYPLGTPARTTGLNLTPRFDAPAAEVFDGETGQLNAWLLSHGPSTREELHAAVGISETNLMPLLAQKAAAVNVTPRHYWHVDRLSDLATWSWLDCELIPEDAEDLIAARQCGESPTRVYVGWTGHFEHALCERAHREQWANLPQLLWACEPMQWAVDEAVRKQWADRKAAGSLAPAPLARISVMNRLPTAKRLLQMMLLASEQGYVSPVSANRITRPRGPREMVNLALIAMLVRVGALSSDAAHPWARHALGADAKRWTELLASEHVLTGSLAWDQGIVRRLLETALVSQRPGWASAPDWTALLTSLAEDAGVVLADVQVQMQAEAVEETIVQSPEPEEVSPPASEDISSDNASEIAEEVTQAPVATEPLVDVLQPVEALIKSAQSGNADAQYQLARQLERGDGVPVNPQAAIYWLRKAAEAQHVQASVRLGAKLWRRELDAVDPEARAMGLAYLNVGTAKGHAEASYLVGMAYLRGDMVHRNLRAAINLLKRAARAGHPRAAFELARILRSKMDAWVPDTVELLRVAARRGVPGSRELLAEAEEALESA